MNKEIIEKYIKFGIDNWYKLKIQTLWNNEWENAFIWKIYSMHCIELVSTNIKSLVSERSLIDICTSKEFIEAVARWIQKNNGGGWWWYFSIEEITHNQAIAIRDWKLEDFILWITA